MAGTQGSAWGQSWARAWGGAWGKASTTATPSQETTLANPKAHTPPGRKWYVRRGQQILLFNTAADADAWLEAQAHADAAIVQAQKTSRRARKRLRERLLAKTTRPTQTIDIPALTATIQQLALPVDLPGLIKHQDWQALAQAHALAAVERRIWVGRDEEEVALLLVGS